MVIICPECSTKFRINSERIPDTGAKVRCARCKHIFLAEKPAPEEKPVPIIAEPEVTHELPEQRTSTFTGESEPIEDAFDDSFTAPESTSESTSVPEPTPEPQEDGFSYDQFRELDSDKSEDDNFTFSGTEEMEESSEELSTPDFDSNVFAEETEEEDSFSFSGPEDDIPTRETEKNAAGGNITEETERVNFDETANTEKTAGASDTTPMTNEDKLASIFEHDDEPEEETEPKLSTPAPQKGSPATSIIRVLLLLILGLVIIGGVLYYINGPEQIERAIQQILGQQAGAAEPGQIALINLEGKFINNQDAGELFVIRGEAANNFKDARGAIQVKGVIFDQNGKPLLQKTIFCGNPIDDQELQTLPFSKLEEMMRNQFGKSLDNMKVNSKEAIPFVIAFRDLPKTLSEFSVDVTSSEPASK